MASQKPNEDQLKEKIREIMEAEDEGLITLKTVRSQLEKHFNVNLKENKEDIKRLVMEVNSQDGDEDSEEEEIEISRKKKKKKKKKAPAGKKKSKKRKRRGSDEEEVEFDDEEEEERPKKKRKLDHIELDDTGMKRVVVDTFRGRLQVHIRTYYYNKREDKFMPSKKGICLNTAEWDVLKDHISEVDDLIERKR